MTACVIIEVSDASNEWTMQHSNCHKVPEHRRPTILHPDRATAEREAVRLSQLHPHGIFAIFEARAIAIHEKNLPAIENNKLIAAQIIALNEAIGMPKRWSERDRNSRSRYIKTIGHDAGYLTDISREVKTDDGFQSATLTYERMLKTYQEYAEQGKREAEAEVRRAEREKQALIDKRKADIELAAMLLRYELPLDASWSDVLENLRARHQRLDLAVAMVYTRGDWFGGPYRVRGAMDRFMICDNEDKDIANDVLGCMDDFEDGRVFRDTTWNYTRLFDSVEDKQLVADVQKAMQMAGDE